MLGKINFFVEKKLLFPGTFTMCVASLRLILMNFHFSQTETFFASIFATTKIGN
jgi:hypothetical protein